jgi:hypothetical protein
MKQGIPRRASEIGSTASERAGKSPNYFRHRLGGPRRPTSEGAALRARSRGPSPNQPSPTRCLRAARCQPAALPPARPTHRGPRLACRLRSADGTSPAQCRAVHAVSLGRLDHSGQFSCWPFLAPRGLARCPPTWSSSSVPCPILICNTPSTCYDGPATSSTLPPRLPLLFFLPAHSHILPTRPIDHTSATRRSVVCRSSRGPFLSLKPTLFSGFLFGEY